MVEEHRELLAALQSRDPELMLRVARRPHRRPDPGRRSGSGTRASGREQAESGPAVSALLSVENLRTVLLHAARHAARGRRRSTSRSPWAARSASSASPAAASPSRRSRSCASSTGPAGSRTARRSCSTAATSPTLDEEEMEKIRGNDISMIFQEPMTSLNPVFTVGDQIAEAVQAPPAGLGEARRSTGRSR